MINLPLSFLEFTSLDNDVRGDKIIIIKLNFIVCGGNGALIFVIFYSSHESIYLFIPLLWSIGYKQSLIFTTQSHFMHSEH